METSRRAGWCSCSVRSHCDPVPVGETGIAFVIRVHFGQVEALGARQCLRIDLAAADNEDLFALRKQCEGFFERVDDRASFGQETALPRDNDVRAPRQRRPIDSNVLRPITTGWPEVIALKRRRSSLMCQIRLLPTR